MIFNCGDLLELLGPVRGNLGGVVVSRAFRVVRGLAAGNLVSKTPLRIFPRLVNPLVNRHSIPTRELFWSQTNSNFCFVLGAIGNYLAHSFHPHAPLACCLKDKGGGDNVGATMRHKILRGQRQRQQSCPKKDQFPKEEGVNFVLHTQGLYPCSNQKQELIWRFETRPVFPFCQYCFSSGPIME